MHEYNLLNTFSAPAAVLNCNGEILFMNDEWRLYSIINDGNQAYDPIGVSYFDV